MREKITSLLKNVVNKCESKCTRMDADAVLPYYHQFRMKIKHILKNSVHSYDMLSIVGSIWIIFFVSIFSNIHKSRVIEALLLKIDF